MESALSCDWFRRRTRGEKVWRECPKRKNILTVVMPVCNGAAYLDAALESVSRQTVVDYQLLVIDNGSTDNTRKIIESHHLQDRRIHPVFIPAACLVTALNSGLSLAKGQWIARMDADDLMDSHRLELQLRFALEHPGIDVIACRVDAFPPEHLTDGFRRYLQWQNRSLSHDEISADLFRESPICHPSVMFRRETVLRAGGYRQMDGPEDYDLWLRLAASGARFGRVAETLFRWRVHPKSLSRIDPRYRSEAFQTMRWRFLASYLTGLDCLRSRPLWICGAGRAGRKLAHLLMGYGLEPAGFIDVDPRKIASGARRVRICSIDAFENEARDGFFLFTAGNWGAAEAFEALMIETGRGILMDYLVV